ncbi:MAG: ABC transporter ATP-binding protein [Chloroflexi bacterium AL-W]|nr:ABC transporter ATP-binding protein [Chloroflexi bacterium AL-W]
MTQEPFIELQNITKDYVTASNRSFTALTNINLQIGAGELVAMFGKSGSGKSTLLNLIAGLDRPTSGQLHVAGTALQTLGEDALAVWRGHQVGVVFQFFQFLPTLTVEENVLFAMDVCRVVPRQERKHQVYHLLELVGIADQAEKLPATLSGGQQQRAAIARALANDPPIVVADEPTGNLDSRTANMILDLFVTLVDLGKTLLVVTHDEELAQQAQRMVRLADGMIVADQILAGGVR